MKTHNLTQAATLALFAATLAVNAAPAAATSEPQFNGKHYRGRGDVEYVRLLDTARRMFEPDPELQNLAMLYEPKWDGFVEGPTWDAWWIQNSYGTTYSILPLLREPFVTFLQHAQDLWFDQMGDGHRTGAAPPFDWVAPDGCLCDCARPGWIVYKQGDGRTAIHDWGMEFTAAGVLLQSELLLISRDPDALAHYLPRLERSANFIETRRDPTNNLFLAGPAGNLLAPSYAGWHRPDGSYGQAYLAGLSITYIAALDRLIELEKLAKHPAQVSLYTTRRDLARQGLPRLTTEDGCFIRSLDPDGVKHGVFGAAQHGYFEASPNHDAIAFRVADDAQSDRIYRKLASLPGLRPYDFILPNYPSYDDMYEKPEGLWAYGTWVNGGHWSTCEARMVLAYYRLGQFEDARRSMRRLLTFAERFRMDNPPSPSAAATFISPTCPSTSATTPLAPPPPSCAASLNTSTAPTASRSSPISQPPLRNSSNSTPSASARSSSSSLPLATAPSPPSKSMDATGSVSTPPPCSCLTTRRPRWRMCKSSWATPNPAPGGRASPRALIHLWSLKPKRQVPS
jgi:hypothetical protein